MNIKSKIKKLMNDKGLNIHSLAEKAELSQACIANWYNKRNYEPSVSALQKICNALDITMAQLFCDENDRMFPLDSTLQEVYSYWQKLIPLQREAVISHLKGYSFTNLKK